MLRSMFAGVSGLRTHQVFMDVVGNNIANVNTTGYKASNALFQDFLSQILVGAGAPTSGQAGGSNPAQVGLGVRIAAVTTNFAQGAAQLTGRATDFAIQGDGMFIVDRGGVRSYTRAGAFGIDGLGQLVTAEGGFVLGWQADTSGIVNSNASIGIIRIPVGQTVAPVTTTKMDIGGNLPSNTTTGGKISVSLNVYNSLGAAVPLRVEFEKVANGAGSIDWQVNVYDENNNLIHGPTGCDFNLSGALTTGNITVTQAQLNAIAGTSGTWAAGGVVLDFGAATDPDRLTGAAELNSVAALSQNGAPMGSLVSFSIAQDGLISGVFSNGKNQALGQISLALFTNPAGLERAGSSQYFATVNSGEPIIGIAGQGGRGTFAGGTLEMSNVDLAQEFTNLIVAQRGFQANARTITASDEILQDLVNLKR